MCVSDPGIGRTDHRCDNAYQYADPGTDRKYPKSYLYASGSDQPTGEAGESYTTGWFGNDDNIEECDERGIYKPSELDAYGSSG